MKKFFALMLVVAMLSVAGSAMAVTVTGATTASVTAAETAKVDLTTVLSHDGEIDFELTGTAKDWTVVTDKAATFMPPAGTTAATYTANIVAIETWESGDVASHAGEIIKDRSTTLAISVTVAASGQPEEEKETESVARVVTIKAEKAPRLSFVSLIKEAAPVVKQAVQNVAASLLHNNAPARTETNLQPATSDNYDGSGTPEANAKNIAVAGAKLTLGGGDADDLALAAPAPFTVAETGNQPLNLGDGLSAAKLGSTYKGLLLKGRMFNKKDITGPVVKGFAGASAASGDMVFLDANGAAITTIPESGDITAVAYVEAGETYEPVIYTTLTSTDKATLSADFAEASNVEVTTKVTSGEPTLSSDTVFPTGKNFTVAVGSADKTALESYIGVSLDTLPASTTSSDQTPLTMGALHDDSYYYDEVALIPVLQNMAPNSGDHKYVVAFKYEQQYPSVFTIAGAPAFYPNGVSQAANGTVYAIDYSGTAPAPRTAVAGDTTDGKTGFLVFSVTSDNAIATFSAANASFTDPRLIARTTYEYGSGVPGVSSSSGGCSAGTAALALAVLGSFILTRKK